MPVIRTAEGYEKIHVVNLADDLSNNNSSSSTPVKTAANIMDGVAVAGGTTLTPTIVFSNTHDVTILRHMSIVGFQGSSNTVPTVITEDSTCTVELWVSDTNVESAFYGPIAFGEFSNGFLFFGQVYNLCANFVKLRIVNSSAVNTSVSIKFLFST